MAYTVAFKPNSKILEIGGGNAPLTGPNNNRFTINMDIRKGENVEIVHDIQRIPWPVKDGSFDGIFGRYIMEHIPFRELQNIVKEMHRVLKPGGKIILFVPNIIEQCKLVLEWGAGDRTSEMLYGSQEFEGDLGCHKSAFDEKYARELLKDFKLIRTCPHPKAPSDLIIEAYKLDEDALFERSYFEGGGFGYDNYRDFATHYSTARIIMENNPESLLDIGAARGYLVRILENQGVKAVAMDISKNAWHNRATDSFILWDAREIPWKRKIIVEARREDIVDTETYKELKDKEWDICFSINFLEHIEEDKLDDVIRESVRVSERGIHGIHFSESPFKEEFEDQDITHVTMHTEEWWKNKFSEIAPDYPVRIGHPRILEYEEPERNPPVSHMPPPTDNLVKLNLGSFLDMFYDNWINCDIINLTEFAESQKYNFRQLDITKGLPWDDNSVDHVISNHLIEHLSRDEGYKLLKECHRVMKPGGVLRISTPDTKLITNKYIKGEIMDYRVVNVGVERARDDSEAFHQLLMVGHKTLYDEESLAKMMEKAGFKDIKSVSPFESRSDVIKKQTLTTHPSLSIVLECIR